MVSALLLLLACDAEEAVDTADEGFDGCALPGEGTLENQAYALTGPETDGRAGTTVAALGDLGGDGWDEVAVADWQPGGAPRGGDVYVLCGPIDADVPLASGCSLYGGSGSGYFGQAVSSVGDWDGDGVVDVAIADPRAGPQGYEGAVYILPGVRSADIDSAIVVVEGSEHPGYAGTSLAHEDLDGDGMEELLIGAYGGAYAFGVGLEGVFSVADAELGIVETTGVAGPTVRAGDLTGDGHADVVMSAVNPRGTLVFHGPFSGLRETSEAEAFIDAGDRIAATFAITGDYDADERADIALGSSRGESGDSDPGRVLLISGMTTGTMGMDAAFAVLVGADAGDQAGWSVADGGDLDGDGEPELLIGAIRGGYGAAYVVGGPLSGELLLDESATVLTNSEGSLAGWSVAGGGDLDGDGCQEALIGAIGMNTTFVYPSR